MNQDLQHLKLLSVFHYVVAGLAAIFACFPLFHLIFGLIMVFFPEKMGTHGNAPPPFIGWIFIIFAGCFILFTLTLSVLILISGRFIAQRRHHLFCTVMAAVECLFMPFGTVLGVFTLIVLMRDSVKELFAAKSL
ncbi:MAG: hypothetical protein SV375_20180 [Thermodesulfobacteriota bacterium]|nr:hypothetical protein [Thermodesulfobacteriota bacterium]